MKYMINDSIFDEKLGCTGTQNNTTISAFPDFFNTGATHLSNGIALTKYVNFTHGNWDNYNQDDNIMSDTANNDSPKSEPQDPNWLEVDLDDLDKLYNVYDWLLAISAFLTGGSSSFFFFLDDAPAEVSVALCFRFCFFLAVLSIFFFAFSSILLIALVAACIFLTSLSKAFLAKSSTFFISFFSFFFSAACSFAASFLATRAYFSSRVNHCFLSFCGPSFTNMHSIFVLVSGIWSLLL